MNKVIWLLYGNPVFTASSRIHGLAVHNELLKRGFSSHIAYLPRFTEEEIPFMETIRGQFSSMVAEGDIIILQKLKKAANLPLLHYFRELGLQLVLIDCDLPLSEEIGSVASKIICTSRALRDRYAEKELPAVYIEDAPELYKPFLEKKSGSHLYCYWFGDNTNQKWNEVRWLQQLFRDKRLSNWKLITISNHRDATLRWSPDFLETFRHADAVALPVAVDNEESSVKSANRLLQSMALSLPVICSPLPSYNHVITSGDDGFICKTSEEWIQTLKLLEDADERREIGTRAFQTAMHFRLEETISLWIKALGLDSDFQTQDLKEVKRIQHLLNIFFYRSLVIRNPNYWRNLPVSFSNFFLVLSSVSRKIRKRLS
ncbi:hypothetical protein WSM22_44670 [Cytophagales bacterium WSM2-2]|nr:hypothetical protein WSM22_44670 [Cytophagales bacterium WSM2-2]